MTLVKNAQSKKDNKMRKCTFQYDVETCLKRAPISEFKGASNMCRECRKIYNKDYYQRKKNSKSKEFLEAEELEKEIQEMEE